MGIYNCEKTLSAAIDSIVKQTYEDWELILCDDCSTDSTYQVAKEYAEKNKKIVLLRNDKNLRLSATLNKCLSVARGELIARMDADDYCKHHRLKVQVDFLDTHPEVDCVGSAMIVFDEDGEKGVRRGLEYPTKDYLKYSTPFAHPTIMMRKKAYDELDGYTKSPKAIRCDDTDLWFRFYALGFNGYNIQEPLYYYREGINDYKKRTFRTSWETFVVTINGFRLLNFPKWKYVYALRPLLSAFVPKALLHYYHKRKDS